jgi:Sec7-like guanine-nucleotide exchange factor
MFIYNVTIKVADEIAAEWLKWLKEEHVPAVLATDCFTKATIVKLLEIDDNEGPTYAIQYLAESKGLYNHYIEKFADDMRQKSFDKWGDRFIAFRSLMQVIH